MNFGCQGPFCHGTGGLCGCNCRCCPPPCCARISVYFDCGAPKTSSNPAGCTFEESVPLWWSKLNLPGPPQKVPEFTKRPVLSRDRRFIYGAGTNNCSVPCETVCVQLQCGGNDLPCCCLELLEGRIISVGNGYVTAAPTVEIPGCGPVNVLINGAPPPVFVFDCQEIIVTLQSTDTCCLCQQVDVQCAPCGVPGMALKAKALYRRKVDPFTGKVKIDARTGKPIITIDKKELIRRIMARSKLRRKN